MPCFWYILYIYHHIKIKKPSVHFIIISKISKISKIFLIANECKTLIFLHDIESLYIYILCVCLCMYACYINIGYLILLASFTAFKLAHIINKVQCLCVTNTIYIGLFQKKKNRWVEDMKFPGLLKSMWKFQGSIKKEMEFPVVFKKKTCGISMGLHCFWPMNLQGVPFTKFCRISMGCKLGVQG